MKKNLKYFEDELSRLSKEFTEFKKKYIGKMASTKGFGIIKTMINIPDIKFEPSNIVFRFPEDDEV